MFIFEGHWARFLSNASWISSNYRSVLSGRLPYTSGYSGSVRYHVDLRALVRRLSVRNQLHLVHYVLLLAGELENLFSLIQLTLIPYSER